ncbi:MAG: hypothetical protein ACPGSA_06015, partial [Poseidonia sp.]
VVVNVAAHWHEHHQCAQQQCNPDTAEDGLLLVILVSQHMSFTPYGLYAVHPTPYTIYIGWGAKSLKKCGNQEKYRLKFTKIPLGFRRETTEIRKKNINFENDTVLVLV